MNDYLDVPDEILRRMRAACAHLPEAYEERAHAGVRWRIRDAMVVHVVTRDREPAPITYMTLHAAAEELDALVAIGDPYFAGWGAGLLAVVLRHDGTTDWDEVRELVTESYCIAAPKKLRASARSACEAAAARNT